MAASAPSGELRGIGSDGADGVWFSDIEDIEGIDTAYLTHYSPEWAGLTRVNINPPFPEHGMVWGIAHGTKGEEWFAREEENQVSRITPSREVVNETLPTMYSSPHDVVVDAQGNMWFTERRGGCTLGRLSPAGELTEYPSVGSGDCYDLTIGPDGNIWIAVYGANQIVEVSATTGAILASYNMPLPVGITTSGGRIWVTEDEPSRIAAILSSGQVTEYELPSERKPEWLTTGPDGAIWFAEATGPISGTGGIGRLEPDGALSETAISGGGSAGGITATNDAIYFTQDGLEPGLMRIPVVAKEVVEEHVTSGNLNPSPPRVGNGNSPFAPPPVANHPCAPVRGNIGKRILAALKCTAIQTKLEFECGFGVARIIVGPLKILAAVKTADGLYDLSKVQKGLRPVAKLINGIRKAKFGKHALPGFRTGGQVIKRLKNIKTAYEVVEILPDLAKAVSRTDLSEIALDLDGILGLRPCVEGVVNALE